MLIQSEVLRQRNLYIVHPQARFTSQNLIDGRNSTSMIFRKVVYLQEVGRGNRGSIVRPATSMQYIAAGGVVPGDQHNLEWTCIVDKLERNDGGIKRTWSYLPTPLPPKGMASIPIKKSPHLIKSL